MTAVRVRTFARMSFTLCVLLAARQVVLRADVTASILGTVRDASSAAMPNVTVTVTNLETNLSRKVTSDTSGAYRILAVPVGTYRVEASQSGFQTFVANNVVLTVDQERRVDITMDVGNLEQRVEVSAAAVQVETTSTQVGNVIEEKAMLNLPLNGRSYINLLSIQAGVAPQSSSTGNISVNGQRGSSNSFLVNGGDVNEGVNFGTEIIPNLDSIAEFHLITNSFDAEYGRFSGAVMNAITKSGSNGFHGSAFDFIRNNDLDAKGFFDSGVPILKRNQFGYAVGGPAIKNKIFWFTDYQGTRTHQGSSGSLTQLPSVAQRGGTFNPSDLSGQVAGPYFAKLLSQRLGYTVTDGEDYSSPQCGSTAQCVFPNGVIPTRAILPLSANLLQKYVPLPNAGDATTYRYASQLSTSSDNKVGQRVDFVNKKTGNWYGYYHLDDSTSFNPSGFGAAYGNFNSTNNDRAQQGVLSNTLILGPTAVNEARLDFTRLSFSHGQPTDSNVSLASLGFVTGVGSLGINSSIPGWESVPPISLSNFSFGRSNQRLGQYNNTYHIGDTFSKILGTHSFKIGGEFRYLQINERNVYAPNGNFTFDGSETGSDIADFLLGAPASYIQASYQLLDSRTKYGAIFVQDSWRVKPNFTLNYGLRWEVSTPWYDTQNRIETIVPGQQSTQFPGAPKGWVYPGDAGIPTTLAPTTWHNFGPRLGLAWSPNASGGFLGKLLGGRGKTAIRAAAGIYYTAIQDAGLFEEVADAPYGLYWVSSAPPMFDQPYLTRSDGSAQGPRFPFVLPTPGSAAVKNIDWSVFFPISSSPGYLKTNKLPYSEHFNFSIQRQLTNSTMMTVAYVGTEGHKLFSHYEANPGDAALCLSLKGSAIAKGTPSCGAHGEDSAYTLANGSTLYGTRSPLGYALGGTVINGTPTPYFGENSYLATTADSNYNSLQVTVERRASDFTFLAAYTFSKAIDDASSYGAYLDFYNFRLGRSLSTFDCAHNFVISYTYNVPFDRVLGVLPKRLTQGWAINGITRLATGFPISMSQSGDRSLIGGSGVDRPNFVGPLVITKDVKNTPNHTYFNKAAFTSEALGGQGTSSPRFFHGPGQENFDLGAEKTTKLRESMSLLIRAEFFNALEHANFGSPSGSFTSGSFGRVTSASAGRIGQVSAKFLW